MSLIFNILILILLINKIISHCEFLVSLLLLGLHCLVTPVPMVLVRHLLYILLCFPFFLLITLGLISSIHCSICCYRYSWLRRGLADHLFFMMPPLLRFCPYFIVRAFILAPIGYSWLRRGQHMFISRAVPLYVSAGVHYVSRQAGPRCVRAFKRSIHIKAVDEVQPRRGSFILCKTAGGGVCLLQKLLVPCCEEGKCARQRPSGGLGCFE